MIVAIALIAMLAYGVRAILLMADAQTRHGPLSTNYSSHVWSMTNQ